MCREIIGGDLTNMQMKPYRLVRYYGENFKRISTLCQYVHSEYGVIDHFIESLTDIRNSTGEKCSTDAGSIVTYD